MHVQLPVNTRASCRPSAGRGLYRTRLPGRARQPVGPLPWGASALEASRPTLSRTARRRAAPPLPTPEGDSGARQPPPEPPRPQKLPVTRCWGSKLPITAAPSLCLSPERPCVWAPGLPGCCPVNAKGHAVTCRQWHMQTEQREQHGYVLGPEMWIPVSPVTWHAASVSSLATWE